VPSALGVSLLTFYALSFVPVERLSPHSPHARYRDLPLFFNAAPTDVRTAVETTLSALANARPESAEAQSAAKALVQLGGAALPIVLPRLDAFPPEQRARLGVSLAPLARRMHLDGAAESEDPAKAVRFWTRFWEASEVEFRVAAARNATRRWVVYGDAGREREVFRLDTFALDPLFELVPANVEGDGVAQARRLVDALAHVTERDDRIGADASPSEANACLARWRHYWLGNRTRYVPLRGSDRITAFALESRYGKWALEEFALGDLNPGQPGRDGARTRTTFLLVLVGWLAALVVALPVGVWLAVRRPSAAVRGIGTAAWLAVAAGPVLLGLLFAKLFGHAIPTAAACVALAVGMMARPLRETRLRVRSLLASDAARGGLARGASLRALAWRQGLRDSVPPVLAASLLELPMSMTSCFVLERVFGIEGLGEVTLAAVAQADVGAVMGLAVGSTCWGVFALMLSDLILALAAPSTRAALFKQGARA